MSSRKSKSTNKSTATANNNNNNNSSNNSNSIDSNTNTSTEYSIDNTDVANASDQVKQARVLNYINGYDIRTIQQQEAAELADKAKYESELLAASTAAANSKRTFFYLLFRSLDNRSALYTLLLVSAAMIILPIGGFYLSRYLLLTMNIVSDSDSALIYSGLIAVFIVNCISIGFGIYAYYDNDTNTDSNNNSESAAVDAESIDRASANQQKFLNQLTRGLYSSENQTELIKQQHNTGNIELESDGSASISGIKKFL